MTYTGGCLCGGVQYRIEHELQSIQVCHCRQCQKAQGTPFATNTPVAAKCFHITLGHELLSEFESSPGKKRVFCSRCGSPILSKREDMPDSVRIRAGTIDGPLPVGPLWHAYTGSQANWWTLRDDLPRFPGPADA